MNDGQRDLFTDYSDSSTNDILFLDNMASSQTIDTITLSSPYDFVLSQPTVGVVSPNITISSSQINSGMIYASNVSSSPNIWTTLGSTPMTVNQSGTIDLRGESADININGVSLNETLRAIQDRLNILKPNKELEGDWDQLRELGERYRELEKQFTEKQKMWDTLKSMPPPEIK
jgi:hypothetical protein